MKGDKVHKTALKRIVETDALTIASEAPLGELGEIPTEDVSDEWSAAPTQTEEPVPTVNYAQEAVQSQPVVQQVYYRPQPQLTQEELDARKAKQTLSNLNALLYVGSFLIVAAMAIFGALVIISNGNT